MIKMLDGATIHHSSIHLSFMALAHPPIAIPFPLGALWSLPLDGLLSTQGIMVMLLVAYAGAMWMFLTSAPKVHTMMVSDLELAREFYEGMLNLPVADVPLHYYYNYEQTLGTAGIDPLYASTATYESIVYRLQQPGRTVVSTQEKYAASRHLWRKLGSKRPTAPCLFRPRLPRTSAAASAKLRSSLQNSPRKTADFFGEGLRRARD
jgi:hypothetical protein